MIVLNYAHPLSADQLAQVALALGAMPEVRVITAHADRQRPLADVAAELADAAQLTADEWQTLPLGQPTRTCAAGPRTACRGARPQWPFSANPKHSPGRRRPAAAL